MSHAYLYPEINPNRSGLLALDAIHTMYWEESGNPEGIPVLFLHGGPGVGVSAWNRRFFDPSVYRIILFDQRGAGRSLPLGELKENSPTHLLQDIEKLRMLLKVDKWLLFGGSWGSTLALYYAQAHPAQCLGLILRGIFLCRPKEINWFLYGMREFFPEHWEAFSGLLPIDQHDNLLDNYYARLTNPDPAVHIPAARAWSQYEGNCVTLLPNKDRVNHFAADQVALGLARLEAHYFKHHAFDGSLLENISIIRHLPAVIVQGRYDICCPPVTAYELKRAWPEAAFIMVEAAGHASSEPGILKALIKAGDKFRKERLS